MVRCSLRRSIDQVRKNLSMFHFEHFVLWIKTLDLDFYLEKSIRAAFKNNIPSKVRFQMYCPVLTVVQGPEGIIPAFRWRR